jgi:sulfate transport system permease protein
LLVAVLGWFTLLVLVPAVALLSRALSGGVRSFLAALGTPEALRGFALTLRITALATIVNTFVGVALALVLVRHRFWGKWLADALVDLPFAVSPVIAGLMLIVLYAPEGLVGHWIEPWGIRVVYAMPGMVLACLFVTLPFVVREVVPVLRELGEEEEQAAYTLGAGRWTTFARVTLPSIRWGVAHGVTLTIARSVGEFGALLVVSGNILGRTQTATLYVHDTIESFHPEGAYAVSVALAGLSVVLLFAMEAARWHVAAREGRP